MIMFIAYIDKLAGVGLRDAVRYIFDLLPIYYFL